MPGVGIFILTLSRPYFSHPVVSYTSPCFYPDFTVSVHAFKMWGLGLNIQIPSTYPWYSEFPGLIRQTLVRARAILID